MLETGVRLPAMRPADDGGNALSTEDLRGRPRTNEATQFRDAFDAFEKKGASIVGVSRDSVASHRRFKAKHGIPFRLPAGVEAQLCDAFDVIVEKKMYGKTVKGVRRSTFLFGAGGTRVYVWPKVTVDGHAEDVLSKL